MRVQCFAPLWTRASNSNSMMQFLDRRHGLQRRTLRQAVAPKVQRPERHPRHTYGPFGLEQRREYNRWEFSQSECCSCFYALFIMPVVPHSKLNVHALFVVALRVGLWKRQKVLSPFHDLETFELQNWSWGICSKSANSPERFISFGFVLFAASWKWELAGNTAFETTNCDTFWSIFLCHNTAYFGSPAKKYQECHSQLLLGMSSSASMTKAAARVPRVIWMSGEHLDNKWTALRCLTIRQHSNWMTWRQMWTFISQWDETTVSTHVITTCYWPTFHNAFDYDLYKCRLWTMSDLELIANWLTGYELSAVSLCWLEAPTVEYAHCTVWMLEHCWESLSRQLEFRIVD